MLRTDHYQDLQIHKKIHQSGILVASKSLDPLIYLGLRVE